MEVQQYWPPAVGPGESQEEVFTEGLLTYMETNPATEATTVKFPSQQNKNP